MRIIISNKNKLTKINFSKVTRTVGKIALDDLYDVDHSTRQNGDVLVFNSNTSSYVIETLPKIDGGIY